MEKIIRIGDYFRYDNRAKSSRDYREIEKVRNAINSFEDEADIQQWIYERRQSSFNRQEDYRLFGIPIDAEIGTDWAHKTNKFYDPSLEEKRIYKNSNFHKLDYKKRDIKGNLKYNKDGSEAEYGKFGKKMINLANNTMNSQFGNALKFLICNFKTILISLIALLIILIALILIIYISGTLNSIGSSPFVLCSSDQITGKTEIYLPSAEVNEMATPEYAAKAFIATAKSKGWKNNAIIGTLSYILQEGSGMGTFTYEANYSLNGPSNVKFDKTLNNQEWLNWLNSSQAHNDIISAYNGQTYNFRHYAIGLGLIQDSDVWNNGVKTTSNATKLIEYCESKGKPWQDPLTQMEYLFETKFSSSTAFDTEGINPVTDDFSAEEWCRRVCAGIGMPAYSWNQDNSYIKDHLEHLQEATSLVENFNGADIGSLDSQIKNLCSGADSFISGGNKTIADAAVTLSSGYGKENKILWDMDGINSPNLNDRRLQTYKETHIKLFPNDPLFASCDRSVATAIIWSGADLSFPLGDTLIQYNYLKNSDKWSYVGDYGSSELKSGDVLITKGKGHIKIYAGNEIVQKRFPGSNADMYAGSFHQYFPYLYKDDPSYDERVYAVFRNIKSDKNN